MLVAATRIDNRTRGSMSLVDVGVASKANAEKQNQFLKSTAIDGPYAKYVLGILVIMGVFNFIDRQILAILAEDIKADLGLSDGDLGFLYGTAFAVFYAVFGIPLARVADTWMRTRLIAISVGFWSLTTALSGLAKSFIPLSVCRFGVGVGEAGASPAALSLLYDYFSPKIRTTVMAIYGSGIAIGSGIGLFLGGSILTAWANMWPDPALAPLGLKGWQAAFMVVGVPGLLLALWISSLREPVRGQAEGLSDNNADAHQPDTRLSTFLRIFFRELAPMVPGVNLRLLSNAGAGVKMLWLNICVGVLLALTASFLIEKTGSVLQWGALGVGFYCAFSWAQFLVARDPVCFGMIFGCRTVLYLLAYIGLSVFSSAAVGFWMVPWFQRYFEVSAADIGFFIGISVVSGGLIGMISSGIIADKLRQRFQAGKLYVVMAGNLIWLGSVIAMLFSQNLMAAYVLAFIKIVTGAMVASPAGSTMNDLMLPRTRAVGMALYIMTMNFTGVALGPYFVGVASDIIQSSSGVTSGDALQQAMLLSLVATLLSLVFLFLAIKSLPADEENRLVRARNLGEKI